MGTSDPRSLKHEQKWWAQIARSKVFSSPEIFVLSNQKLCCADCLSVTLAMSFFPPPQDGTGFQSAQQQTMEAQQAAMQRLQAQTFQHSWYLVPDVHR
jgi:hypothetical protein